MGRERRRAVCFLCHCPSGCPDRVLPGALPCGVRTFLPAFALGLSASGYGAAIVWPTAAEYSILTRGDFAPARSATRRFPA
jgi:hypothetical protein